MMKWKERKDMAGKSDNRPEQEGVLVNAAKLGQGLKTTFMGMAMIFDSLGAGDAAAELHRLSEKEEEKTIQGAAPVPSDPDTGDPCEEAADAGQPQQVLVTTDDITKVIVAKIKQKRSNNAKIGQLLKTYGVEKVSSLPVEKYEAFLTDISQL